VYGHLHRKRDLEQARCGEKARVHGATL
jgi:hypothetical protein